MEILQTFENIEKIQFINNGFKEEYTKNDNEFKSIIYQWNAMCVNARQMPAFGVSLDNETKNALKSGIWLNFIFDKQQVIDGMFFERLLIKIEKEWQGFNLIRYNSSTGYNGRCFYLHLNGQNMSRLYDLLLKL